MKICIDMRPALSFATGVGVYLQNLVQGLADIDDQNEYHLFSSSWKERFSRGVYGKNFIVHDKRIPVRMLNLSWNYLSMPPIEWLVREDLDVVHSPSPLLIPASGAHKVTTVMDLYFYFHPEHTVREMRRDYSRMIKKHCEKSDAIIAISDHTKQQLVEHLKIPSSKVYTIRLAADPFFNKATSADERDDVRKRFGIRNPFFLFTGTQEPRKNLRSLLEAFRNFKGDAELVIAGPQGWNDESWRHLITDRVIRTGYVSREELRALYQEAIALIMPSREEGFGLPLLEAMASGTPVIASDIPVFHEVAGNAFLPADPENSDSLNEAMQTLFSDSLRRGELIALGKDRLRKYSWEDTARKTLELYQNL